MKSTPPVPVEPNGDEPQHVWNKRLTIAKTRLAEDQARGVRTREKANRLQFAKARDDVIEKGLVTRQAAYRHAPENAVRAKVHF